MENNVTYCYDILNNNETEWAGADLIRGNMDLKLGNMFYTVPAYFVLFQTKYELNNIVLADKNDVCIIGNTLLFYHNKKYYFVEIRKRYIGLIHPQESINDYKIYLTFIKKSLENKLLFKKDSKIIIVKNNQMELYD